MRSEYDGVKFYSVYDWSIGEHLEKASIILESFDENEEYLDINKVIELYNIQELINSGCTLNDWDEAKIVRYKKICDSFEKIFGKFFGKMSDENFKQICQSICIGYVEDFWKLFVQFGTFKKVSGKAFASYLNEPETTLYKLLQQKELVKAYDKEFAEVLRISEQTPRLIIGKFLQKHDHGCSYSFPKELSPLEYEGILQRYIKLETANLNDLQLLAYSQSSKECPISDKLRLSAKKACETYWENRPFTGVEIGYGMGVEFADVSEIKSAKRLENNTYQITYDIKWLLDNLDYPTILNNFRYIFEQFDECWRSTLVSVESQLGSFEKMISTRGIKEFIKGNHFYMGENISTMQVKGCYDILKQNGVRLEDVLKWFVELMTHEDVEFSDFWEHQQKNIRWLIERDIVEENADGHLKLNIAKVFVLKDLYEHDVICPQYYSGKLKNIINKWCKNGNLRLSDSLFSEPEQNYLNYELNKSAYSNGLDLRNKYAHSTYPEDEKIQVMDYIVLLKIMILVVTKINEEFCLKEQIEATSEK